MSDAYSSSGGAAASSVGASSASVYNCYKFCVDRADSALMTANELTNDLYHDIIDYIIPEATVAIAEEVYKDGTTVYIMNNTADVCLYKSSFCPTAGYTEEVTLGKSGNLWKTVYAASTTISTSDRNMKDNIKPLTDKHVAFFQLLQPVSFTFINGDSGRTHIGFISQDVEEAMYACGLTDLDFAGFCKDLKVREIYDEDGKIIGEEPVLDEGGNEQYLYSLRYEEFIAINTFIIQHILKRVEALENK